MRIGHHTLAPGSAQHAKHEGVKRGSISVTFLNINFLLRLAKRHRRLEVSWYLHLRAKQQPKEMPGLENVCITILYQSTQVTTQKTSILSLLLSSSTVMTQHSTHQHSEYALHLTPRPIT
jgi:hypothetical protein